MKFLERRGDLTYFYCPGCQCNHAVGDGWKIDMENNSIHPSVLVREIRIPEDPERDEKGNFVKGSDGRIKGWYTVRCHSFVKNGFIQYLNDSTHKLSGQTVEMTEEPL